MIVASGWALIRLTSLPAPIAENWYTRKHLTRWVILTHLNLDLRTEAASTFSEGITLTAPFPKIVRN